MTDILINHPPGSRASGQTSAPPSGRLPRLFLRRGASIRGPLCAALAVLCASLFVTIAVLGSDRVDSGWAVSKPTMAVDGKQADDPRIRIAINQVLEQGQLPLLVAPAQTPIPATEPESPELPPANEIGAEGWRPAHIPGDLPPAVTTPVAQTTPIADAFVLADPDPAPSPTDSAPAAVPVSESNNQADVAPPPAANDAATSAAPPVEATAPRTLTIEAASPLPSGDAPAKKTAESPAAKSRESAIGPPKAIDKPTEPLSKQMTALRTRVRRVLKSYYNRPLNSRDNDPWEMMHGMLAYGINSRLRQGSSQGKLITSVGWLCYNKPCKGMTLLYATKQGDLRAKYGVGLQGHMGQFLAMLAQCHVSPDYPVRVGKREYNVQDLVEAEKVTCYSKSELTFKLISLMHYCDSDTQWVNDQGSKWDMQKLIREELSQPIRGAACGGTHRLSGLSLAARTRVRRGEPLDGEYLRAAEFVKQYHNYAFQMQNRDGSLSTQWFRGRGTDPDTDRRVKTTGHILEWLCYSLDDAQLRDARTVRSVSYLTNLLGSNYDHEWEVGPLSHALHALKLYNERVFQPHDDQQEIVSGPGKRQTAKRTPSSSSRTKKR